MSLLWISGVVTLQALDTISSAALRSSRHQEVDLPTTNNSEIINADKYLGLLA